MAAINERFLKAGSILQAAGTALPLAGLCWWWSAAGRTPLLAVGYQKIDVICNNATLTVVPSPGIVETTSAS